MKVGVLGPRGTYSEIAAKLHFKSKAVIKAYPTISDVVEAVARGYVDTGIIPVESMREGPVGETLDTLAWAEVKIKAEIVMPISHSLLVARGTKLEKIDVVLSHPQALSQCRDFLRKNLPEAELIDTGSTAEAAELVNKYGKPATSKVRLLFSMIRYGHCVAAIGPRGLAKIYGLEVLYDNIQDGENNITRFIQIAKHDSPKTGHDKTSIVFYTAADRPGILHEILGEFASRKINLTKIESRPSKKALGDYLFFIDFEGHREDKKVKEALAGVGKKTAMLKVLGSYPKRF